jgi:hypothetical protein
MHKQTAVVQHQLLLLAAVNEMQLQAAVAVLHCAVVNSQKLS